MFDVNLEQVSYIIFALANALTARDRLSVIWKSNLTDKIKLSFSKHGRVDTAIWMHHMDAE